MYCITKWCKSITDSGKDEYTGKLAGMKQRLLDEHGFLPELHKFRLLDDDGEVYAYGVGTNSSSFAPLDRFMPLYGCTEIQYKNPLTGVYETL